MNNYRCPQCDLLNWVTADCCKRCRLPNSATSNPQQFIPQPLMQNISVTAAPQTAVQMPFAQTTNYQTPNYQTPPQFQQQRAGSYSTNNTPRYSNQYQPQNNFAVNSDEIAKAEKNVRNGFVGGIVWASLLAFVTVIFMFISAAAPDLSKAGSNPAESAKLAEIFSKTMIGIFAFMTLVIGGLSFGVRKKSMACAVILIVFTVLSIISSLSDKSIGGTLFAAGMLALFAQAASGISILKKYDSA
jgi:hypothetical protein